MNWNEKNVLNSEENIIIDESEVVDKLCHGSIECFFFCLVDGEEMRISVWCIGWWDVPVNFDHRFRLELTRMAVLSKTYAKP